MSSEEERYLETLTLTDLNIMPATTAASSLRWRWRVRGCRGIVREERWAFGSPRSDLHRRLPRVYLQHNKETARRLNNAGRGSSWVGIVGGHHGWASRLFSPLPSNRARRSIRPLPSTRPPCRDDDAGRGGLMDSAVKDGMYDTIQCNTILLV